MSPDRNKTEQRRPDWAALAVAVVLAAIAAVIFIDVSRLKGTGGYSQVGPATVPDWIGFALIGLAIWTVIEAFRGDFPTRDKQEIGPVVWIVAGLVAQMLLLRVAGFSIATGVLFGLTAAGFGKRKLWITIPLGIVVCLFIWLIFAGLLQLALPAGPLERLFW
ncbi:tripartite tricarboxylate transporter TctB family protein [Neorhizobium petrolearium]|uniref:Tripartite tricarboxylate transporter TctB family protein n=1 Tax=Neorhizobium petrolearium TaxID=515361 RepID=A0ABY8M460_9HYPH|nr:tripartite tricarboxylate transporter TctB family protein [Neorhizobium petrolearium]MCC2613147.1 tripartite tricarboxylate transporter TctB family protein [Neorhizobium petrolearium]WGI68240.1 tripartite tricarboxylate transporter TctB family protein [Neorhizobium petrolearium]